MENSRPLLIFVGILLLVIAGFWGVVTFANRYEERVAKAPPATPEQQPQPQQNPSPPPSSQKTPEPQKRDDTPSPPKPATPPAPAPKNEEKPSPPKPDTSPPSASQPRTAPNTGPEQPQHIPKAGMPISLVLTASLIGVTAFLLLTLRAQAIRLRPNR